MHGKRWPIHVAAGVVWLVLLGYILYPTLRVLVDSLHGPDGWTPEHYVAFFNYVENPANLNSLAGSLFIAAGSVILCALIGIPMAFIFTLYHFPGRRLFGALAIMPITLPPIVGVVSFYFLFGESGIIPRLVMILFGLESAPFAARGFGGVFLVHAYTMYVYFYLLTSAALQNLDQSLLDASRNLGATRWRTIRSVYVPLLTPALLSASLLVFMTALASFSAPYVFASGKPVLALQIYHSLDSSDLSMAQTQTVILSLASILVLWMLRGTNRRVRRAGKGVAYRPLEVKSGITRNVMGGLGIALTILLLLPHLVILWISFVEQGTWTTQVVPTEYTLENYMNMFRSAEFFEPVRNSFVMAAIATLADLLLGAAIAFLLVRGRIRSRRSMEIVAMLPWALPGTVVAINLLSAFAAPSALTFGKAWVGTMAILIMAYIVRHLPLIVRSGVAALEQFDTTLESAALNLGASWWRVARTVVIPLIAPGLLAGALLVFVSVLGEFVSSIVLWVPQTKPIAVEIYRQLMRSNNVGMACAYSTVLMLAVGIVILASRRFVARGIS